MLSNKNIVSNYYLALNIHKFFYSCQADYFKGLIDIK